MITHTLGFPRIGVGRELKKTLEGYWKRTRDESQLLDVARELRHRHWRLQKDSGIDLIPVGDFSLYDHVLDTACMLGAVPERYKQSGGTVDLETYFRMARGGDGVAAMEMSKWFNTNYHYIVPEFSPLQVYRLSSLQLLDSVDEAIREGYRVKPVLLGPLSFVKLGKSTVDGFNPLDRLDDILAVYMQVIQSLPDEVEWIQMDEPALALDLTQSEKLCFLLIYERLTKAANKKNILLATYFSSLSENAHLAFMPAVKGVHLDLTCGTDQLDQAFEHIAPGQSLSLGVVDGRNIWRVDADAAMQTVRRVVDVLGAERVMLGSSCSLLHSPIDLDMEERMDPEIRSWMAFSKQKCQELRMLADCADGLDVEARLEENRTAWKARLDENRTAWKARLDENRTAWKARRESERVKNPAVCKRASEIDPNSAKRATPHGRRKKAQQERFQFPLLPTTTIGSFPQSKEIRSARRQYKTGAIDGEVYRESMRAFIREAVSKQEELGLDALVHGEAERNDMVEYFGEQLDGYCTMEHGWVQSYGSRCVKPPIIYGDVQRPKPMTLEWITYAQSLTDKPMKGMLTGPVTMLGWSFVRDDQPLADTCRQIALAIRDEVRDLEAAGIHIIQIDEPAFREGLPLRKADWEEYLTWAVESFQLASGGVEDATQIHTHMCYCEFNDILDWIAKLDADVISIETSRSKMEVLQGFQTFEYPNDIGPGIWDIHSPRIPSVEEMQSLLEQAMAVIPAERLWINPDCGLKTRDWPETIASLKNLIQVAKQCRQKLLVETQ